MSMKLGNFCVMLIVLSFGSLQAAPSGQAAPAINSHQLPELQCDRSNCDLIYSAGNRPALPMLPSVPSTIPTTVGPPAGQRFAWVGAGYPSCQSILGLPSVPTFAAPYEYISSGVIPVPLGSTHASLSASMQSSLSGGPTDVGGLVGILQIRRSGNPTWTNSAASYIFTVLGVPAPGRLSFGSTSLQGLENLAALPGSAGVPTGIEVRLGMFPVYATGFNADLNNSAICQGKLEVTF